MTTLNDIYPTDDVDDVLDTWVRELMGSTFRSEFKNVETLSATRVLLDVDTPIQRFDCNGADRIAKMPASNTVDNHPYLIKNETVLANYNLTIQNSSGSNTYCVLPRGEFALIFPDGSGDWVVLNRIFTRPLTTGQITANQNNYAPSAAEYSDVIRIYSDAARDITGFGFPAQGKTFLLINHGSYTITLKNESASSVAANRLAIGADFALESNKSVVLYYDASSSRWRMVGGAATNNTGWITVTDSWTYASANTINVPSGAAAIYKKGMGIRITQTTDKFLYIAGVSDTLLTVTGGTDFTVANAAITAAAYTFSPHTAIGFPVKFNCAAPTWSTATIDNGTGGQQPTAGSSSFIIRGNKVELFVALSSSGAIKNGAGATLTVSAIPATLPNIVAPTVGVLGYGLITTVNYLAIVYYVSATSFSALSSSSIADNASIAYTSLQIEYEY